MDSTGWYNLQAQLNSSVHPNGEVNIVVMTKHRIIRLPHVGHAFADGMARVVDFEGGLDDYPAGDLAKMYNGLRRRRLDSLSGSDAEAQTVRMVWEEVGRSVRNAIGSFESEGSDGHLPTEQAT